MSFWTTKENYITYKDKVDWQEKSFSNQAQAILASVDLSEEEKSSEETEKEETFFGRWKTRKLSKCDAIKLKEERILRPMEWVNCDEFAEMLSKMRVDNQPLDLEQWGYWSWQE